MASIYRVPVSDTVQGSWVGQDNWSPSDNDSPGGVELFSKVDETTILCDNNGTVIWNFSDGNGALAAACKMKLSNPGTPTPGFGARMSIVGLVYQTGLSGYVWLRLWQGASAKTPIKLFNLSNVGGNIQSYVLTTAEKAVITNWDDLYIEVGLQPNGFGVPAITRVVSAVELETY